MTNADKIVYVDPCMFPWAQTYFLEGLEEVFGKKNIKFFSSFFRDLRYSYGKNFNFVISDGAKITKYSIDWFDVNDINDYEAYEWCDVYGKVNTNWSVLHTYTHGAKVVAIGPSFGIKKYNLFGSIKVWLLNSIKCKFSIKEMLQYARYYYREYNRLPLKTYVPNKNKVENGYVFFLSTLWYDANWNNNDNDLNTPRYKMMKIAASNPLIHFEGGFVIHNKRNRSRGYESSTHKYLDMIYPKRLSIREYHKKIYRSYVILNTPAVVGCHGWKLAEALAYGKAIVSIPLKNELPHPLEHGKNIHFVENTEESINNALEYIYPEYRQKLERGARQYWEKYCSPIACLKLMKIIE